MAFAVNINNIPVRADVHTVDMDQVLTSPALRQTRTSEYQSPRMKMRKLPNRRTQTTLLLEACVATIGQKSVWPMLLWGGWGGGVIVTFEQEQKQPVSEHLCQKLGQVAGLSNHGRVGQMGALVAFNSISQCLLTLSPEDLSATQHNRRVPTRVPTTHTAEDSPGAHYGHHYVYTPKQPVTTKSVSSTFNLSLIG